MSNAPRDKYFLPNNTEPLFEVKEWNAVAVWNWHSNAETCAICHESLLTSCIACQSSSVVSSVKCRLSWGSCSHGYHSHCIKKWVAAQPRCPLCQVVWEEQDVKGE